MDPRHLKIDERLKNSRSKGVCVYCGDRSGTRDHIPSKVLLDKPYPSQLPVVPACETCNQSFSLDEQYLACVVEVASSRSVDADALRRRKVRRIMEKNRELRDRIRASRTTNGTASPVWVVERSRVRNVVRKLAKGHVAYELYAKIEEPTHVAFAPLVTMDPHQRSTFEYASWPRDMSRTNFTRRSKSRRM